jgi:hypothetical protein
MDVKKTDYAIEKEQRLSVTFKPDEESKDISLIYKCEPNINHLEFEHKIDCLTTDANKDASHSQKASISSTKTETPFTTPVANGE